MDKTQKTSIRLSIVVILLAALASLGGILWNNIYQDNDSINRLWLANDIITLFFSIPLMTIAVILTIKGSLKAKFIWLGTLWYMIYNYIFYVYGAAFNKFFLLHISIFILSVYAFILGTITMDFQYLKDKVANSTTIPFKKISIYLLFFGLFIGGMWVTMSLNYVFTGNVPEGITNTGHSSAVVFSTDLFLLVSPLLVGGFLLWRKSVWGYAITSILMIKCILYPMVLALGGFLSYLESKVYDQMTPGYLMLEVGCFICLWYLMKALKTSNK